MAHAFALLLALVPFSPPSGWTVDPVIARQPVPFVWVPNYLPPDSEQPRIWAQLSPVPNVLPLADATASDAGASAKESSAMLCGAPAKIVEMRSQSDGVADFDAVFEKSHGSSYIVAYSRTRGASADLAAEQFIRHFCPSSPNAILALSAPSGWALLRSAAIPQQKAF